jgi:acetolactate synthase I/II/III large subunit
VEVPPGVLPAATPVVHIARAPSAGLYSPVAGAVGAIALIIEELAPRLRGRDRADWDVAEVDRTKRAAVVPAALAASALHRVVTIARELTPAGTIATADVPVAPSWQSVAPRELLIPNGLATLGYAVPAAIAAQLACPDRCVIAFARPSALVAAHAPLSLAASSGLPVVVVVACNEAAGGEAIASVAREANTALYGADSEESFRRVFYDALTARRAAVVHARLTR